MRRKAARDGVAMAAVVPASAALLFALAAAAVLLPSPVRASDDEDLAQLRQRVVELRRELVMRDLAIDRLAQELAELRSQSCSPASQTAVPPPVASSAPTVIRDLEIAGRDRIEEFELEEPAPTPPPPSPVANRAEPAVAESGGEELYDQGYALFHQQKYPEAERAFRLFLSRFVTSDLADNAMFWIGESRWARGDFAAALESYTATVEQYPDGNKVPDALLKAGRCLETLGQVARAVRAYEEVVLRFAGSAAAVTAQERLDALR